MNFQLMKGVGAAVVRSLPRHGITRHQATGTKPAYLTRRRWKHTNLDQPFPARRSLASNPGSCALFRSEPLFARCSLAPKLYPRGASSFRSFTRAMLLRSEALTARCSFVPKPLPVYRSLALKSGPCAVPPFHRSEPLPMRCYAFPSLRALARASFPSRRLVSVR